MKLKEIIAPLDTREIIGDTSIAIKEISCHSGTIGKNSLFLAIKGNKFDGHDFISEALARGARAIISENAGEKRGGVAWITVSDSRTALALVADQFYRHPSWNQKVIGITGTNGKTTTSYILESIFKAGGYQPGVIGTINYRFGNSLRTSVNTTPDSLDLQKMLREMLNAKISPVFLEISSHALEQKRIAGIQFDAGVFTNFSPEHLDYHQNLENYFQAKLKFFSQFLDGSEKKKERHAVINADDSRSKTIEKKTLSNIIRYGIKNNAEVKAEGVDLKKDGIAALINTPVGSFPIRSFLIGEFNLYNILAAIGVSVTQKIPLPVIKKGIENLKRVPGRLEKVETGSGPTVFIDYAHTSDALQRVLINLQGNYPGRIVTVFGCGGDRDKKKRPLMGKISARYSDLSIITSDNPRGEDPEKIIGQIERGIKEAGIKRYSPEVTAEDAGEKGYLLVPDRRKAIKRAISLATPGDVVIIAGKGHENYQIIGIRNFFFNDREEVKNALKEATFLATN